MHKCNGCGEDTSRSRTTYNQKHEVSGGECPRCHPESFEGAFAPFDRLVSGPEAMPHLYTRDAEGVYHAKDELVADTADMMSGPGPSVLNKRKHRRTTPMTPEEIRAAVEWGNQCLR